MPEQHASHDFFGSSFNLPETEEQVLAFWEANGVFKKSVEGRKKGPRFVFYEGPPGANGRPGIHHVLPRVLKDVIVRYKSLRGYYVPRRGGWDTHGLPVEIAAEKELGIKSKKEIDSFGIAAFNEKCQQIVWQYKDEWERLTARIGYWLDMKNAYVTYEPHYIESLWWVVKQISDKGFLYQGHKVIPWCPRCGTGLSSHELAQGYKEVTDVSIFAKFKLLPRQKIGRFMTDDHTYILSWTTTPWTLPGNVALAVGANIEYQAVRVGEGDDAQTLILAQARIKDVMQQDSGIGEYWKGSQLVGLEYEPLFDIPELQNDKSHRVYAADFVTTEEGTGVVHTAVMYGVDDYELGKKVGLPQVHTVETDGTFSKIVPELSGMSVKDPETEKAIMIYLKKRGFMLRQQKYDHEYPHCWRCGTPVLYYARTAWFVAMSKLRAQLQKRNNTVNWIPAHIKQGRFGEWLKDAKDWNFSRERYWGTPLPVWVCDMCKRHEVIGSIDELGTRMGGSQNQYWIMRHGHAESNVEHILDSSHGDYALTPEGKRDVERAARSLKDQGIDLVISSDYHRTQETAHIVAKALGVPIVSYDKRLREFNFGSLSRRPTKDLEPYLPTSPERMTVRLPHGESIHDLRARVWHLLDELEHEYKGRRILLVSHDYPTWMLQAVAEGWSDNKAVEELGSDGADFLKTGDARRLFFRAMPRNDRGELDLHRPFVDTPSFSCHSAATNTTGGRSRANAKHSCDGTMRRVSEVIDVWYDSGAMPLAQLHYPFENKKEIDGRAEYPADYIAEGVDQTRGWFYTLLAVATLLGLEAPYKNVIVNNFINDKDGQKMSKSKGNVLDPWELIAKHGIDAVRWYFYAASEPGDPKNFDEADITKMFRKMHLIFYNTLSFYSLYGKPAGRASVGGRTKRTLLDQWILTRMTATVEEVTHALDTYQIRSATTAIESFLDDLSRWYIRVSRRRFQRPESAADHAAASRTLREVLQTTTKLLAPFMPFFAEGCYHRLRTATDPISVHLADWPRVVLKGMSAADKKLLADMALIRETGALALAKRAEAGMKVRQPLASLTVKNKAVVKHPELVEILKAEVNVKAVFAKPSMTEALTLDTALTPELLEEGTLREFLRSVQELRQKADLNPQDTVQIYVTAPAPFMAFLTKHESQIKKDIRAKGIQQKRVAHADAEADLVFDRHKVWLGVKKV